MKVLTIQMGELKDHSYTITSNCGVIIKIERNKRVVSKVAHGVKIEFIKDAELSREEDNMLYWIDDAGNKVKPSIRFLDELTMRGYIRIDAHVDQTWLKL